MGLPLRGPWGALRQLLGVLGRKEIPKRPPTALGLSPEMRSTFPTAQAPLASPRFE